MAIHNDGDTCHNDGDTCVGDPRIDALLIDAEAGDDRRVSVEAPMLTRKTLGLKSQLLTARSC